MKVPFLAFHLTDRCQLDCQHCLRDPARKALDLDASLIEKILDQARDAYGVAHVTFTGGEPTLHPRFEAVVDSVVDHGMSWNIVTNGRSFAAVFAKLARRRERILGLKSIVLSLDGAEEATHDAIRERGSYREVLEAAAVCVAHKVPFGIQMIINARNEAEIEALGLLAAQLGAHRVLFGMVQPTGTPHDAALFLPAATWKRIRDRIARLANALAIDVELPEGHYEESRFVVCNVFRGETLHVDVEGRLSLCCMHSQVPSTEPGKDVVGDLRELSLLEAHRRLIELIRRAQDEVIASLATSPKSEWEHFHCNSCLARFGRSHWTDEGAAGAAARRERWHGVWAPGPHRHAGDGLDGPANPADKRRLRLVSS